MSKYGMVVFNRFSGRLVHLYEAESVSLMKLTLIQKGLTARQDALVFNADTGVVEIYAEGVKAGHLPKLLEKDLGVLEDYCPGLLEAFNS